MPSAEHFPIYFPHEARRAFASDGYCRRIAKLAHLGGTSRVLELCGGPTGLFLAREVGCAVIAVDADEKPLEAIRERVRAQVLANRVDVRRVDFGKLSFQDGEFHGVLAVGRVPMPLEAAAKTLRRFLAPRGRLVMTYPVKVGRNPFKVAVEHWERKIGEPLLLPREALQIFERNGYEPEAVETLDDRELDEYYRDVETFLAKQPSDGALSALLRDEVSLHRSQGGKASVSLALVVARRKEPGEKPPASRDAY